MEENESTRRSSSRFTSKIQAVHFTHKYTQTHTNLEFMAFQTSIIIVALKKWAKLIISDQHFAFCLFCAAPSRIEWPQKQKIVDKFYSLARHWFTSTTHTLPAHYLMVNSPCDRRPWQFYGVVVAPETNFMKLTTHLFTYTRIGNHGPRIFLLLCHRQNDSLEMVAVSCVQRNPHRCAVADREIAIYFLTLFAPLFFSIRNLFRKIYNISFDLINSFIFVGRVT